MNYEQKHKEALERAKRLHSEPTGGTERIVCEQIFPELKESDGEWIKDDIKDVIQAAIIPEESKREMLDWLEKQGEQPTDKIDTKFKVGDWIVNKGQSYLIADIDYEQRRYLFEIGGYTHEQLNWEYIENADNKYHLWTIDDAKDGDVLTCYSDIKGQPIEQTGIIKQYVGRHGGCSNSFKAHFGVDWNNNVVIEGYMGSSNIYPATKEQRDLLFQKMKDAGYEWDDEKKELAKIEVNKNSAPDCDLATHDRFLSCLKSLRQRIGV